jgi:oleate hydratase
MNSRCTFDLLRTIPSASDPAVSVKDEFFAFNARYPFHDRARLIDRNGGIAWPTFRPGPPRRLRVRAARADARAKLDGRRIEEFFSPRFFSTEFG